MNDVVIAGIGQTPVGEHWEISLRELALDAIEAAREDAGDLRPQALFAGNMLAPSISSQAHLGALIADFAGLIGIEATSIEAAGASGGAALRQAYLAVAAGAVDIALVIGVEKMTDMTGSRVEAAIATAVDGDYEAVQGLTPTAQAALLMRRYLHEFGVDHDCFANFPLVAHANGEGNPNAMFRKAITPEMYHRAGVVSEPLNMFDVAPSADAAALIWRAATCCQPVSHPWCASRFSIVSGPPALHDRPTCDQRARIRSSAPAARQVSSPAILTCSSYMTPTRFSPPSPSRLLALPGAARAGNWPRMGSSPYKVPSQLPLLVG
jgi:acetyl-CoA C-acetyltransferase